MKPFDIDWLVELIPDAALLVGPDQVIAAANARADVLFAAPPGGLRKQPLEVLVPEQARHVHHTKVADFFAEEACRPMGSALRYEGRRLDGELVPMDITLNRIRIADQLLTMAVIRDDSDRQAIRDMKDELEAVTIRLTRAQEVGGLGWWELDSSRMTLRWSPMVPALLGLPEDTEPSLERLVQQCHPDDREALLEWHRNYHQVEGTQKVYRIHRPDGTIRWIRETIDPGAGHRVLGVLRDITTEKALEERLRRESVIDELTGLYNRKQFNRDLKSRYSAFTRGDRTTALIMYDFDHFKNINDCHGHLTGDRVLSQSSSIVTGQLRPTDHAYRLGGEEFAIILTNTAAEDVFSIAERLRRSIESTPFRSGGAVIRATVSVGIARFRDSDTRFDDVLRRADEALYQSKFGSRNMTSDSE